MILIIPHGPSLSFPTINDPLALRARFHAIIQNVHGDTQHDQSERSERVLNSAMLIENLSASVSHVTVC